MISLMVSFVSMPFKLKITAPMLVNNQRKVERLDTILVYKHALQ